MSTEMGNKIRACRLKLGMTQAQLAQRTGLIDQSTLSKLESGKHDTTVAVLGRISSVLNTPIADLIGK
jgi:transcriptional regulator with XRE-family HTH domain